MAGLVNAKLSIENAIISIQKLYVETEKLNPGDDPHSLLIKVAASRIRAANTIKRLHLTEDEITLMAYQFSILPSFLPKGLNIKLLALQFVSKERADIWTQYPEFQSEIDALELLLQSRLEKYGSLKAMYDEQNPHNQVKFNAPVCYEMVIAASDALSGHVDAARVLSTIDLPEEIIVEQDFEDEADDVESPPTYKRAMLAIEYNQVTSKAWERVQTLPEAYATEFLECLEDDPKQNAAALADRLTQKREKELRPYDDEAANDALAEARTISTEAEAEFRSVYELLKDQVSVEGILKKIEEKFGPTEKSRLREERARAERQKRLDEIERQADEEDRRRYEREMAAQVARYKQEQKKLVFWVSIAIVASYGIVLLLK